MGRDTPAPGGDPLASGESACDGARMHEREVSLRRLSINDTRFLDTVLRSEPTDRADQALDPHVRSLIRLGILVAMSGPPSAFEWATADALANGATPDELVEVLYAAAPLVGSAHVVAAAPRLARALGYDLDADLETLAVDGD